MYWVAGAPSGVGHHSRAHTGPPAYSIMSQRSGWGGIDSNLPVNRKKWKQKRHQMLYSPSPTKATKKSAPCITNCKWSQLHIFIGMSFTNKQIQKRGFLWKCISSSYVSIELFLTYLREIINRGNYTMITVTFWVFAEVLPPCWVLLWTLWKQLSEASEADISPNH